MTLAEPADVQRLLVCPRCRSDLAGGPGGLRCTASGCAGRAPGAYPVAGRWPVLVDVEDTVLDRRSVAAAADRITHPATHVSTRPAAARRRRSPALRARRSPAGRAAGLPRAGRADALPAPLRRLVKPPNRVAARNVDLLLRALPGPAPRLLVVGGATVGNGVSAVYRDPRVRVVAFDLAPSPVTHFVADAHRIPLPTGCVDAVLVQAVLEHVLDPPRVVAEIHRVLRDGGLVYAETPFLQQVHAGAHDFTRFTASGHRWLFRRFEELAAGAVAGPGTQLLWSVDHAVRGVTRSSLAGRAARGLLCWLPALDRAVPAAYAEDDASAVYFLGRRRDGGMSAREAVAYYRGAQQGG
ncbi:class I SAM-dependent methyltransferase [Streptomyces longwoodensis]|uniref:class I SAM-dependent methyltransferase n=1 Tax=Streptomyces longwoodensis TaxID=68231 RepID=UPI003808F9FE